MITKEYLQQELIKRIDGYKRGVETTTDDIIAEMKSILVLVDGLEDNKYNDALKRAEVAYKDTDKHIKATIERIFPELRESEDERIRKQLISICDEWLGGGYSARPCLNDVKWLKNLLEKQKEQKSFCLEPIFMVGDVMRTWQEAREGITDGLPVVTSIDSVNYICTNKMIPIARQNEYEFPPNNHSLKTQVKERKPAEWSEEDEKILEHISNVIAANYAGADWRRMIDWLDNLRPQPHWKPSEEQMKELKDASAVMKCDSDDNAFPSLKILYEQLEKL